MTEYQGLKHEVKRSWKLKNAKVVPVMMKNLMERRLGPYSVQSVGAA